MTLKVFNVQSGFSQIDKIGNNANIGMRALLCEKNPVTKCYPKGYLIDCDSKSNTILSTLT